MTPAQQQYDALVNTIEPKRPILKIVLMHFGLEVQYA